jgi:uncharacterized MAPEG superfamily protein
MAATAMTTPLWCLLGFILWTLLLLTGIGVARVSQVVAGSAQPNSFTSGVPHGSDSYWRLNRAHMNCLENLPLFAAVVLTAAVLGINNSTLDTLAVVFLLARIGQTTAHLSSGGVMAVNVRFTFFLTQIGCILGFLAVIVSNIP